MATTASGESGWSVISRSASAESTVRTRGARRLRDVPDDGVHRLRQPGDPLGGGDAVRRRGGRHRAGGGDLHGHHGPDDEPAVRAGVRARPQRLRRVHHHPRPGPPVAGRDGVRRDRGRAGRAPRAGRPARGDHARHPARGQALDRRRHRPVHRARRVPRRGHHGQQPGDGDRARRPHGRAAAGRARRPAGDDRPDRARRQRRDPDRDPRSDGARPDLRRARAAGQGRGDSRAPTTSRRSATRWSRATWPTR